jgi:hypothetical protein
MRSVQALLFAFLCLALSSYKAAADVPETGFKSLFIGHSFFRPFADAMPDYVGAAGIPGHTQTVVFNGGANGAPQALWLNATKSAEIKAVLDGGDVELFGMTYHPTYPGIDGYVNWINYALARNPNTRFALALPWSPYPSNTDAASYASTWLDAQATGWHGLIDTLRGLYPGVDIFSIPYGQSAVELRLLFADGNLPDVQNLQGSASTSIYTDNLGHAGDILKDLGRLVWLNALYDVDLSSYSYGPGYTTDLHAIAKAIMDGHNPNYDAAYHIDADGDKVGDALDKCPLVANPDQTASTIDPARGVACEGLPPGC